VGKRWYETTLCRWRQEGVAGFSFFPFITKRKEGDDMAKKKEPAKKPKISDRMKFDPSNGAYGEAPIDMGRLSPRQQVFVAEYILDFNVTRAYKAAGYTGANTASKAYKVLQLPQVQKELTRQLKERQKSRKITTDRVIEELSKVALADIRELFDENGNIINPKLMNDTLAASIASIELFRDNRACTPVAGEAKFATKIKAVRKWDKMKALELLGRYLGLDKVKYELTGPNGESLAPPVFNINFIPMGRDARGTAIDPLPPIR